MYTYVVGSVPYSMWTKMWKILTTAALEKKFLYDNLNKFLNGFKSMQFQPLKVCVGCVAYNIAIVVL